MIVGAVLQFAVGLRDAFLFSLIGGLVVAQLLPPGPAGHCDLPRRD